MSAPDLLFYIFAAFTAATAVGVVISKNAVASALSFLLSLVGTSVLFALLDAGLLAVLLIFVYAGAVVALFLFIIMLIGTQPAAPKPFGKISTVAAVVAFALLSLGVVSFAQHATFPTRALTEVAPLGASLRNYGAQLFTTYLLPVQIVGFLLLIAMLGVIVLSKKFDVVEEAK